MFSTSLVYEIEQNRAVVSRKSSFPKDPGDRVTAGKTRLKIGFPMRGSTGPQKSGPESGFGRRSSLARSGYGSGTMASVSSHNIKNDSSGCSGRLHKKEAYTGTGIGLAMVKKGVERMGGQVGVESKLGEGSRFLD